MLRDNSVLTFLPQYAPEVFKSDYPNIGRCILSGRPLKKRIFRCAAVIQSKYTVLKKKVIFSLRIAMLEILENHRIVGFL